MTCSCLGHSSPNPHSKGCPLEGADRRLEDVHQQWHQVEKAYFTPEKFRVAIQSAIQTARTVTFILQNHKHVIPNFDVWYRHWQERLAADPLMRWMKEARNKIEKQGDLKAYSFVRAEIIASYLKEEVPHIEIKAELFDAPWKLIKSIPKSEVGKHVKNHGTLTIERRWVENTLPDYELLDAVAIAYGTISLLVEDAHRQMGLYHPMTRDTANDETSGNNTRNGRLPCMIGHSERRSLAFSLSDGHLLGVEQKKVKLNVSRAIKDAKHYGLAPEIIYGRDHASEEAILAGLFETAKKIFLKDGYHIFIAILLRQREPIKVIELRPEKHGDKYLMMRKVGHDVAKTGADAVIVLSEAWIAPADRNNPYQRAADSPAREEVLCASLVTKEGAVLEMSAKICRENGGLSLRETHVEHDALLFAFAPIYEAWGRPVPDRWRKAMDTLFKNPAQ